MNCTDCALVVDAAVEISTPAVRGRLGVLFQMTQVTGIWISSVIGVGLDQRSNQEWRYLSLIVAFLPLFMAVAMALVPETPYWLLKKGAV